MSDKKFRNGVDMILNINGETKTDAAEVYEILNDFCLSPLRLKLVTMKILIMCPGYRRV